MYKITDSILMSRVDILETFLEGKKTFEENHVVAVKTNADNTYFEGTIHNRSEHLTKIRFKETGQIKTVSCNCVDFKKNLGDCKHIVALFFFIRKFEYRKQLKASREKELKNMIIEYSSSKNLERIYLEVEYNLEIEKDEDLDILEGANLSIRLGESRLYLIRDMDQFFTNKDREELEFGKFFTYNSKVHKFKTRDRKIMEFIHRVYESGKNYIADDNRRLLQDKNIYLTPLLMKEFIELMGDKPLNIKFNKHEYENVRVLDDKLPLTLDINVDNDELYVGLKSSEDLEFLTTDGKYILGDGKIYELTKDQREKIIPIYDQVIFKGDGKVNIPKKYREGYISNVLRNSSQYIDINFSEEVQDMIYETDLDIRVYFDNVKGSIVGKISFIYDDIEINPFSSNELEKIAGEKILLRDSEREGQVLSILEGGYFKVVDGGIYLDEDDEIFNLVSDVIPRLQRYSNVYYSTNFENIKVNHSKIGSTLKINDSLDLLEINFEIDGEYLDEIDGIFEALRDDKKYFRLRDGTFLPLKDDYFKSIKGIMKEFNISVDKNGITMPKYMGIYLDEYIQKNSVENLDIEESFSQLLKDVKDSKEIDYKLPETMDDILRDYQKKGFNWLKTMSRYGFGGILADDMGLGKTIQVIYFIMSEKRERGKYPSLVVVPTSLVYNWESEVEKFSKGDLKTLVIQGSKEERLELAKDMDSYDLIITSYPLLRNDLDLYENTKFRFCILDEAQNIKNSESLNAKSTKQIRAENKFALTGTPMENSLSELWSIFDFLMPGYLLSRKQFVEEYEKPIFRERDNDVLKSLNNKIKPFILRRLKKDVLKELPEKIEQKVLVDMTDNQKQIYTYYINTLRDEIADEIQKNGYSKSHIKILTALTRLRQICCDPRLFLEDYDGGSGKMDSLETIIDEAVGGHRILIFSQFTSMLDIIQEMLDKKKIENMYLNGSTPMEERNNMVKEFNDGKADVFLVSLKAGGSGLNLVGADMVIHFDPWWNPAVEEQATDRAYRLGQENKVQVIKLITKGTIEEKIFELQEHKKEMIDLVIKEGETLISKLDEKEILSLFEL